MATLLIVLSCAAALIGVAAAGLWTWFASSPPADTSDPALNARHRWTAAVFGLCSLALLLVASLLVAVDTGHTSQGPLFMAAVRVGILVASASILLSVTIFLKERVARRHLAAQYQLTRLLARAGDVGESAADIVATVCRTLHWDMGALWLIRPKMGRIEAVGFWSDPSVACEGYARATRGASFPRGTGLPGRVWETGQAAWIPDLARDDNFPRQTAALEAGLRCGMAVPIAVQDQCLGVLELFARHPRPVNSPLLAVLRAIGGQLGQFVQRARNQRESEMKYRAVTESAVDAVVSADVEGVVIASNRAVEAIFGWTEAELIGRPLSVLMPERYRTAHQGGLERLRSGGQPRLLGKVVLVQGLRKDGSEVPIELSLARWVASGTVYYTGILRDVSERQRNQEVLETANRELQGAMEARTDFLASMSHELRTPLNAILGFTDLLRASLPQDTADSESHTYLAHIHTSGARLLQMVNDLLDLAKIDARGLELNPVAVDLFDAVKESADALFPQIQRKGLVLALPDADLGLLIVDPGRFHQILLNLLSNAIKFTPRGGRIQVEVQRDAVEVHLSVVDTGPGISEEDQRRLFRAFEQGLPSAGTREGTGLGLVITKRLVEAHGGRIDLQSSPGGGSRFTIHLPTPASSPAVGNGSVDEATVLIVEDDPRMAGLLARYVTEAGFPARTVADGRAAMLAIEQSRPLAVVLDIVLPGLDGWEVLQWLKRTPAYQGVPVIIVSVTDGHELGLALGAVDYFVKPVAREQLVASLARYVRVGRDRPRILAVDDDPAMLDLYLAALEPAGYDVLLASGGRDGIAHAAEAHPDLILLDLLMPEMSGFQVIAHLREQASTRDIPVLVVTGHQLTPQEKEQLTRCMVDVMAKGRAVEDELRGWLSTVGATQGKL